MDDLIANHAYGGDAACVDSVYGKVREKSFAPFAVFKATRRFRSLDGWRAFAILAVIWHHSLAASFDSPIAKQGRHGVTLFFVISGFLIITLLLRSQEGPAGFALLKFWGRRTLRILPIYYAVLIGYATLVYFSDHSATGTAFFRNLPFFATFTTNWFVDGSEHTIFFFSWSVAAEEQFYLVWPLIEILVPRPVPKFILLAIVAVTSQAAFAHQSAGHIDTLPLRIAANVPLGIMLGTVLAHLLNNEGSFRIVYRALGRRGSALGCLALTAGGAAVSPSIGFGGEILVPLTFMLLIASTVMREDNDLAGVLRWQPIVWIGTVSYGMYMMHMLALNAVRKAEHMFQLESPVVLFLGSIAAAVALASLSFLWYERPFLAIKDRFFRD